MIIKLGVRAKDKITGFEGIVTGKASYLTGCDQYSLQPEAKADGSDFKEGRWFDVGRLVVVNNGILPEDVQSDKNGADFSAPIK
jgi:hypothetical protein